MCQSLQTLNKFALGSAVILVLIVVLSIKPLSASPQKDFYIRQAIDRYFELPEDAVSLSLGGSNASFCDSASCIYLNPAGLAFVRDWNIAITGGTDHTSGDEFIDGGRVERFENYGYGVLAVPMGHASDVPRFGTAALGYSRYQGDTDDAINTKPDGHRRSLGYGIAPIRNLALGYSFTFYDDQLQSDLADLHSHARFLHLFGLQFKGEEGLTMGALFKLGIGQSDTEDFQFESNGLSHLRQYTGALGIAKRWHNLKTAFGIDYSNYTSRGNLNDVSPPVVIGSDEGGYLLNARLGAEAEVFDGVFLRLGVRYELGHYEFERSDLSGLSGQLDEPGYSAGIGYAFHLGVEGRSPSHLDYGFEYFDTARGDWQHLFSLTVPMSF